MPEQTWKGNPRLEPLLVEISTIATHPRNPRRGDLPLLAESLDAFGQTRPIVVMPWNERTLQASFPGRDPANEAAAGRPEWIVAGNHTYRAAVEVLAWTHIAVVKPELEPDEYEQYLLMDNKASDASEYDEEALIPLLERLRESGDFAHTGWDDEQAEDFIAGSDRLARSEAEREFKSGFDAENADPNKTPLFKKSTKTEQQVMLAYSNDDYQDVVRGLGVLRREYGAASIGDTVARAVSEQFERVFHGEGGDT